VPHLALSPEPGAIASCARAVIAERRRDLRKPDVATLDRMLGGDSPLHADLLSYVLFDRMFIDALLELGRQDARSALSRRDGNPWAGPDREPIARHPLRGAPPHRAQELG
jgi:hypothetical protein